MTLPGDGGAGRPSRPHRQHEEKGQGLPSSAEHSQFTIADEAVTGTPQYLVQFQHPEVILELPRAPIEIDSAVAQPFWGIDPNSVTAVREHYRRRINERAINLLADPGFVHDLARAPFQPGDRIVAFGDSLVDDLQSWAYLLGAILQSHPPFDGIRVINRGRSGDTTADLRQRAHAIMAEQPDWAFVLVGLNDAKQFRRAPASPLISPRETHRNITEIAAALAQANIRNIWILPPPIDENRAQTSAFWKAKGLTWNSKSVADTAQAISAAVTDSIDLVEKFAISDMPNLLLNDGVHPNLNGHEQILRALCGYLITKGSYPAYR